ncbi:MAG TPA: hypothetical protein VFF30_12195 [Nitrososphaerales archaeon]|nr:hypothetical protein [Nitrososphaerales archaeon]
MSIDNSYAKFKQAQRQETRRRVERAQDFDEIFELVKRIVEQELGKHRAGLTLILSDMPNTVGAYHPVGSNNLVVNRALVDSMRKLARDPREINSFVFMILLHEYLHSLGYLDEGQVRKVSRDICSDALGPDHITVKLANANWLELYPELVNSSRTSFSKGFEVVKKFDSSSMSYIG